MYDVLFKKSYGSSLRIHGTCERDKTLAAVGAVPVLCVVEWCLRLLARVAGISLRHVGGIFMVLK